LNMFDLNVRNNLNLELWYRKTRQKYV
jgi:hypothetical protein